MATVNLGRLKPVFKGAYNSSTAYVVDDIVTYANETYINIQAGSNQQPNTATEYWTKLAAKGTDGTDIGTTITTQGDLLYRDGSGLQRLAKGTAGQALKMNSSANAPEWGTISSDFVKIDSGSFSSVSYVDLDGTAKWGTADTYVRHHLIFYNLDPSDNANVYGRQLQSGTENTGDNYSSVVSQRNSGNTTHSAIATDAGASMQFTHDNLRGSSACAHSLEMQIGGMHKVGSGTANNQLQILYRSTGSNHDGTKRQIMNVSAGISPSNDGINTARTGLRFYPNSGTWSGNYIIYGLKA